MRMNTFISVKPKKGTYKRRPWNAAEKAAVHKHFGKLIMSRTLPGKDKIIKCLQAEPCLQNRSWQNIKDFCRNSFLKKNPLE